MVAKRPKRSKPQKQLLKKIKRYQDEGKLKPGTVVEIDVRHDDRCDLINNRGGCNCGPEICEPRRVPFLQDN